MIANWIRNWMRAYETFLNNQTTEANPSGS